MRQQIMDEDVFVIAVKGRGGNELVANGIGSCDAVGPYPSSEDREVMTLVFYDSAREGLPQITPRNSIGRMWIAGSHGVQLHPMGLSR